MLSTNYTNFKISEIFSLDKARSGIKLVQNIPI